MEAVKLKVGIMADWLVGVPRLVMVQKIFLINRGVIKSGGSVSRAVDYFSVSLVIIYDVYFFVFYLD